MSAKEMPTKKCNSCLFCASAWTNASAKLNCGVAEMQVNDVGFFFPRFFKHVSVRGDQHFLANAFPCSLSEEALRKVFSSQWSEDFTAVQVGFPPSGELNAEWDVVCGGLGGGGNY